MINKVILVGNLGDAPETGETQGGVRWSKFSLATNKRWTDKATGEKREKASWHRVIVWGDALATLVAQRLGKGSRVYVEGELETRKFQNKDGRDQYVTEVVVQGFSGQIVLCDSSGGGVPAPNTPPEHYRDGPG